MRKELIVFLLLWLSLVSVTAQEIQLQEIAALDQVYGDRQESEGLLSMNDLGIEFGYAVYETVITVEAGQPVLEVENVRDYASVYVDHKLQGWITDHRKKITLNVPAGKYRLRLYAENIGRITYGPEILDNSKGLFGGITLEGAEIGNWKMTPLLVRDCKVNELAFTERQSDGMPCFYRGGFEVKAPVDTFFDLSGWGMGEVWVNGHYLGSYWENISQQTIPVPASVQMKGRNHVVVFELKDNGKKAIRLSDKAIFN